MDRYASAREANRDLAFKQMTLDLLERIAVALERIAGEEVEPPEKFDAEDDIERRRLIQEEIDGR